VLLKLTIADNGLLTCLLILLYFSKKTIHCLQAANSELNDRVMDIIIQSSSIKYFFVFYVLLLSLLNLNLKVLKLLGHLRQ